MDAFNWTVVADTKNRRYFRWEAQSNKAFKGILLDTANAVQIIADSNSFTPKHMLTQVRDEYMRKYKAEQLADTKLPTYQEYLNAYGCRNCG